ncbi:winged helix-turn-helix domain-containing protein [Microcoleus sp. F10_A2]
MMASQQPHRQADVECVILEVLALKRTMTTQEVYADVRSKLDLAAADLEKANKRDNERKIDQIIANALQEGRTLCRRGWIERVGKGEFRITGKGEAQLQKIEELRALLDDLMPDDE